MRIHKHIMRDQYGKWYYRETFKMWLLGVISAFKARFWPHSIDSEGDLDEDVYNPDNEDMYDHSDPHDPQNDIYHDSDVWESENRSIF